MLVTMLTFSNVSIVMADPINLNVSIINPNEGEHGQQRGPIVIPEVNHDGSTLSFVTSCDGCELRLINEDGEVEYTTIVNSSSLVLPSYLIQ